MASRAEIEAGGAFVRLFLKDDMSKALSSTMKAAGDALQSTGKAVAAAGAGIAAAGAGILAPIIAGVNTFMELGSAATDAAGRTGLSVAALSELGFAAGQTGASIDDVEIGIKKMASLMLDAEQGTKTALDTFDSLGLKFTDLKGLSPEDQFSTLAKAIADIQDPSRRAAMAVEVFGRSGTQLLPMIGDLEALRSKARELGIVMSEEDAAAADELGDAWDILKAQGTALFFQIGAAVAGPLQQYAAQAMNVAHETIAWVRENRGLIIELSKLGIALVTVGTAVVSLGGLITGAGMALSAFAPIAAPVIAALLGIGGALSALYLLDVAGILDMGPALESVKSFGSYLGDIFMPLLNTLKDTVVTAWSGISEALQTGDWKTAGEIAMAGLEVAVAAGLLAMQRMWNDYRQAVLDTILGTAQIAVETLAKLSKLGGPFTGLIGGALAGKATDILGAAGNASRANKAGSLTGRQQDLADAELKLRKAAQKPNEFVENFRPDFVEDIPQKPRVDFVEEITPYLPDMADETMSNEPTPVEMSEENRKAIWEGPAAAPSTAMPRGIGAGLTTYSAAAAQAAGFMGSSGTPEERTADGIDTMIKTLAEQGRLIMEQTAAAERVAVTNERFLASFQYG